MNAPREDTRKTFRAQTVIDKVLALREFLALFAGRIQFLCRDFALTMSDPDITRRGLHGSALPATAQNRRQQQGLYQVRGQGFWHDRAQALSPVRAAPAPVRGPSSDTPKTRELYVHAKAVHEIKITHAVGPQKESRVPVGEVAMIFERTGP